jgi:hypothetical protein
VCEVRAVMIIGSHVACLYCLKYNALESLDQLHYLIDNTLILNLFVRGYYGEF